MTHREMLKKCHAEFILIERLTNTIGSLRQDGKPISLRKAVQRECAAAIRLLTCYLDKTS